MNLGDRIESNEIGPTDLQRSYFSSADIAFDLQVSSETPSFGIADDTVDGGLMNKVFTVIFDVSLKEPAILNQPNNITGTLQFGIGNEPNLFEFEDENNNDGFSDGALDLDIDFIEGGLFDYVPLGTGFSTDLLAEDNPADVPEGDSALGFSIFSLLSAILLKRQARFRKVV